MALNSSDLFLLQRGLNLRSCTLSQLDEYISDNTDFIANIIGDDPITVSGSDTLTIGVTNGSSTDVGVVSLTDSPVYNDTRSSQNAVAVTPAGLVANWVPRNWSNIPTIT